jgi:hypothetical protein
MYYAESLSSKSHFAYNPVWFPDSGGWENKSYPRINGALPAQAR